MIECLEDHIALIVSDNAEPLWQNKIPGFRLRPDNERWWDRGLKKIQGTLGSECSEIGKLVSIIRKSGVKKALINFATYGIELEELWEATDLELFVHCHGFDIHFNGNSDEPPYLPLHGPGYL